MRGNIQAKNAEIYVTVEGTLNITGHLEIKSTGNVSGGMLYVTIAVEKGAHFQGAVQCEQMVDPESLAAVAVSEAPSYTTEIDPKIVETYEVKSTGTPALCAPTP